MQGNTKQSIGVVAPPANLDQVVKLGVHSLDCDRTKALGRKRMFGGSGPNIIKALTGRGIRANAVALFPVSACPAGDRLMRELGRRGVTTEHIIRHTCRMKLNLVIEFEGGVRRIIKDPGDYTAGISDYDFGGLRACQTLAISGSLNPAVVAEAVKQAEARKISWSWNPAACHFSLMRNGFGRGAKFLQLNREEAAEFTGLPAWTSPAEIVAAVQAMVSPEATIVTCGPDGAYAKRANSHPVFCPAPRLNRDIVVGLGDRHFALLGLAMLRDGGDLGEVLAWVAAHLMSPRAECRL